MSIVEKNNFNVTVRDEELEFENCISEKGKRMIKNYLSKNGFKNINISSHIIKIRCERKIIDELLNYIENIVSVEKYEYKIISILRQTKSSFIILLKKEIVVGTRFFEPFGIDAKIYMLGEVHFKASGEKTDFPYESGIDIEGDFLRDGMYHGIFRDKFGVDCELYIPNENDEKSNKANFAKFRYGLQMIELSIVPQKEWKPFMEVFGMSK